MKPFYILLICTLPLICHAYPSKDSDDKSLNLDAEEDVAELDNDPSESGKESQIQPRSGSFDYVTHIKSGLLASLGQASASIASGSSGSSSSSGYKSHDSGHHGNSIGYDPWSFKKSVLNTIFQAVKAITGGVTALKGQLIKGSGIALSASGNIVAASGDKVTDVGKSIINSAQINTHPIYGHSGGGGSVHPFAKFSSLSGASSGGSSSSGGKPGPVVHTETITTYEIPSGHGSYGPPSKPPSYSSATHQYLPPPPSNSYSGGAPFSSGHAAFEAPSSNYLPSGYGQDGQDDFNIYGRHKKLTDEEARKAAIQLQEILNMLPDGKTEYTASKTIQLATPSTSTSSNNHEYHESYNDALPTHLGPLESLSHTESITAAYGRGTTQNNPSDIYHQMAKKQRVEETYIKNHPNEGYAYEPPKEASAQYNKYNNYHAANANNALQDLTPIIAALEVVKHKAPIVNQPTNALYTIEKSVEKIPPPGVTQFKYLQPLVKKSKYTYFNPAQSRVDPRANEFNAAQNRVDSRSKNPNLTQQSTISNQAQRFNGPVPAEFSSPKYSKVRRHLDAAQKQRYQSNSAPVFKIHDYQIQDPLLFNHLFTQ